MNAARELADLLKAWAMVGKTQRVVQVHGGDNREAWSRHVHAMDLVAQVNRVLLAMEAAGRPTEHYRRSETEWVKGIIVPNVQWSAQHQSDVVLVAQTTIDQLHALADVIDGNPEAYQLEEAGRTQSLGALEELVELLNDDEITLSVHERRYVFELITALKTALTEHETFDAIDLLRRINELVGYLTHLAEQVDVLGDKKLATRIRDLGRKVRPIAFRTAIVGAAAIQTAAATKELLP
jgi:hypothetical protein